MLARLSAGASQVEFSEMSPGDEHFFLDMDTFRLVLPVPDITWTRVAQMCERAVHPMTWSTVAQVLAALESGSRASMSIVVPSNLPDFDPCSNPPMNPNENLMSGPLVIPSPHPSVPTIVITPCQRRPRETSCQVPYQDSAFHNQLTVPSLPSFNQSFPPMMPPRRVSPRGINYWVWKNGHWQAALGGLEPRPRIIKHGRKKTRSMIPLKSMQG
ncbi:hypothetical protein DFH09DRAFT_1127624 [Mycena vulgaris]|nr:hypothetical protein DFH09DRAFT_1127624 [Mycena vulgaris]